MVSFEDAEDAPIRYARQLAVFGWLIDLYGLRQMHLLDWVEQLNFKAG